MLMIMYEDYRLHHARARALYSRRGRRIQLMQNGVVGAAKQIVNGAAQMLCNGNDGFHPGKVAARLH